MADLIDNVTFDEYILPENYTDFEQMGSDIEQRVYALADSLTQSRANNRYSQVVHDTNINTEEIYEQQRKAVAAEPVTAKTELGNDDREETILTYLTARADTDPVAANELAVIYYLANDIDVAVTNFEKAASMGYAQAQRNLAIALEQNNSADTERIFNLYSQAAEKKDAIALNNLGCCYLEGDGTEEDVKKAIKCFEQAIVMGDTLAKINLADCYSIGNGVRANPKKAFKLYCDAAANGNITAIKRTAECYLSGQGTPQSFREALEYYQKAAELGDIEAKAMVEKITEKASPERYNIDEKLSEAEQQTKEREINEAAEQLKKSKAKVADSPSL